MFGKVQDLDSDKDLKIYVDLSRSPLAIAIEIDGSF